MQRRHRYLRHVAHRINFLLPHYSLRMETKHLFRKAPYLQAGGHVTQPGEVGCTTLHTTVHTCYKHVACSPQNPSRSFFPPVLLDLFFQTNTVVSAYKGTGSRPLSVRLTSSTAAIVELLMVRHQDFFGREGGRK